MAKRSKKYIDAVEKVDPHKEYDVQDAIELIKEIDFSNMDSSIDIAYRLDLDVRQADQQLRGSIVLPKGTGNTQTVVVFAKGEKAEEAKEVISTSAQNVKKEVESIKADAKTLRNMEATLD